LPSSDESPREVTASTPASAVPVSAPLKEDDHLTAAESSAGDARENPTASSSSQEVDTTVVVDGREATAGSVTNSKPKKREKPEGLKSLTRLYSLSALLIAGGAGLIWSAQRVARGIILRKASQSRASHS